MLSNYRFYCLSVLVCLVTTTSLGFTGDRDWPGWRGQNLDFTVRDKNIFQESLEYELKVLWRKQLGPGYSSISVFDNYAVTMFSDSTMDNVVALDAETGSEFWRVQIDTTNPGRFGSHSGPISTPLISHGKVFALGPKGRLLALDLQTGEILWQTDLQSKHGAVTPFYGFSTSPLIYEDVLILETGGSDNNAVTGFDQNTGSILWSAGNDTIEYQSPLLHNMGDQAQLLCAGHVHLFGLNPSTGQQLWQYKHGGDDHPMGAATINFVATGENRFFVNNKQDGSISISLNNTVDGLAVEEAWQTKNIKGTYIVPVYHDGHIYGYNSRILTCVDASTGERVWRSRKPGDGFPIIVDDHLVVATKNGKLSIAPVSPEGYIEIASLELFEGLIWSPQSVANGKIYVKSMTEIACVDIVPVQDATQMVSDTPGVIAGSVFAEFVSAVEQAEDKSKRIDDFMAAQERFPVIESNNLVHFVYRGEAKDVSLAGDLVGWRYDVPMNQISGTDFFYYSSNLEPDARITYSFGIDMQAPAPDPLNPRSLFTIFYDNASWFAMPEWQEPEYLKKSEQGLKGRIDSVNFHSTITDSNRVIEIYLPPDYYNSSHRYPVAYVHQGGGARGLGQMDVAVDNLINSSIQPVIVVFLPNFLSGNNGYTEFIGDFSKTYNQVFLEELIPLVENRYRIRSGRENRANIGSIFSAFMVFYSSFNNPNMFGKLAFQSVYWDEKQSMEDAKIFENAKGMPFQIYLDWGKYDVRSPLEGISLTDGSKAFARLLNRYGYTFQGGEANDGGGYASWKNRTKALYETLFPMNMAKGDKDPQSKRGVGGE